ncbi:hypothetical protein D3C85_1386820 [compost metagenome]
MTLNNVSVQTCAQQHTAFQVHFGPDFPLTQIRFVERFLNGSYHIGVSFDLNYCEAAAVVCNTLIDF